MRCPFCGNDESQVKDSRPTEENATIRRRRACPSCGARFTTFERVQLRELVVLKAGDKKEVFDREKVIRSMTIAARKRPVSIEQIERAANGVVRQLEQLGEPEIESRAIGGFVMKALATLDAVAYIRYASVYKDFRNPEDFHEFLEEVQELETLLEKKAS